MQKTNKKSGGTVFIWNRILINKPIFHPTNVKILLITNIQHILFDISDFYYIVHLLWTKRNLLPCYTVFKMTILYANSFDFC